MTKKTEWFDAHEEAGDRLQTTYPSYIPNFEVADAVIGWLCLQYSTDERKRAKKLLKRRLRATYDALKTDVEWQREISDIISTTDLPVAPSAQVPRRTPQSRSSHIPIGRRVQSLSEESAPRSEIPAAANNSPYIPSLVARATQIAPGPKLDCQKELSMEDLKSRLLGIVQQVDALFPPPERNHAKIVTWCEEKLAIMENGKPYTRGMANGTLKHLIAEAIIKSQKWSVASAEVKVEAAYSWKEDSTPVYQEGAFGAMKPDIVVHAKGDPNTVLQVFELKFPCSSSHPPEPRERLHPHTKVPTTQTRVYWDALKPIGGVWLLSPWGFRKNPEEQPHENSITPAEVYENESAAANHAATAVVSMMKSWLFKMTPIAEAVAGYRRYLWEQFEDKKFALYTDNPIATTANTSFHTSMSSASSSKPTSQFYSKSANASISSNVWSTQGSTASSKPTSRDISKPTSASASSSIRSTQGSTSSIKPISNVFSMPAAASVTSNIPSTHGSTLPPTETITPIVVEGAEFKRRREVFQSEDDDEAARKAKPLKPSKDAGPRQ